MMRPLAYGIAVAAPLIILVALGNAVIALMEPEMLRTEVYYGVIGTGVTLFAVTVFVALFSFNGFLSASRDHGWIGAGGSLSFLAAALWSVFLIDGSGYSARLNFTPGRETPTELALIYVFISLWMSGCWFVAMARVKAPD